MCGKPLIAWTIEAALKSKYLDRVFVSTDSEEIRQVAESFGAVVPGLRKSASDEYSPVSQATVVTLREISTPFDVVVQLQSVHPFRTAQDIDLSLEWFFGGDHKFQLTAEEISRPPGWWACELNDDGRPSFFFPETLDKRTQDLPKLYAPNGAVMIADYQPLMESETFFGNNFLMYPLGRESCFDIDVEEDFKTAEKMMREKVKTIR